MSVTLTIKQVPERLAEGLRQRAAANRRSQQQELLLLLERAIDSTPAFGVAEPVRAVYRTGVARGKKPTGGARTQAPRQSRPSVGKLSLDALWERARKLGADMPSESQSLVRTDRDARGR